MTLYYVNEACKAFHYSLNDEFVPDYENFLFKDENIVSEEIDTDTNLNEHELIVKEDVEQNKLKVINICKERVENNKRTKLSRKKKNKKEKITSVAPGEDQKFEKELKFQEEKCFPNLFTTGHGGYTSTYINTKLGFSNYCKLRLTGGLCLDDKDVIEEKECTINYERFRNSHHYMMFLLLIMDAINMNRAQATAFREVIKINNIIFSYI